VTTDGVDGPAASRRRDVADYGRWLLVVIAAGGVIGAESRYAVSWLFSSGPRSFPWATLLVNVVGGFGIGVLMAVLGRAVRPHPLLRPFLGVGVLGGFTTFSAYSTDIYRLIDVGRPELALGYAALTLIAALAATVAGMAAGSVRSGPAARAGRAAQARAEPVVRAEPDRC
jgi:CrcB protein